MSQPPTDKKRVRDGAAEARSADRERADRLQRSLDQLVQQMARMSDELSQIRKMLRRREAQLAKLEAENRKLRRKLGLDDPEPEPDAAEVPPSDDSTDEQPDDAGRSGASSPSGAGGSKTKASAESPPPDGTSPPDGAPKRKARVGGRRPPPAHLPADREHHRVCACPRCGGQVLKRDVEETEVYTAVPSYVRRRVIRRDRVVCASPGCGVPTTAPMPPMPCDRALYDCSFIAWVVTLKFGFMLPLDRIQAQLASQGVHLAMGTLVRLIERATDMADAVDGEHMKQLRAGKYVCFDGTGLKVLIPNQPSAWDGYLEVYTRDELTVFQFDLTKHAKDLQDRLWGMSSVLVTDAESRNKAGAPEAVFANCNAHVVRKFRAAEKAHPVMAIEGLAFLQQLYAIEKEARKRRLVGEALRQHRQQCHPVLETYRAWLVDIAQGHLPPSDPIQKIAQYCLRHWDGLTRFVDNPDLPIDNNEAEREFQRHAKLRLASLFAGSIEGAHRWATLLGVVRTAQKHGLDVQAYLTWMFERRGTHRDTFQMSARELTPAAWRAAGCPGSLTAVEAVAA